MSSAITNSSSKFHFLFSKYLNRHVKCTTFVNTLLFSEVRHETQDANDFSNLITDPDTERKVKLVLMELYLLRETQSRLPDSLSEQDMIALLNLTSTLKRRDYICGYLSKKHVCRLAAKRKRIEKASQWEATKSLASKTKGYDHIIYSLGHNSLHFRVRDNVLRTFYAHRLAQAAMFEQPLVFDCDFEEHMSQHECTNTAVTLRDTYGINAVHRNPFDLYFCNLRSGNGGGRLLDKLRKVLPSMHTPTSMITISEKSYLDLFPDKKKLVYLSPDAPDVLTKFNHDSVYIIGALVDLGPKVPRTLAKAKRDGIQCLRLPLDRYLRFKSGASKNLTLNQVAQILLEVRSSGNWLQAFKHVPKRAVLSTKEILHERS